MVRFQQMSFENAPRRVHFPFNHAAVLHDIDGSLTGHVGGSILPYMNILNPVHCTPDNSASYGVPGAICSQGKFRKVAWNDVHPSSINEKHAYLTNVHGRDTVLWRKKSKTHPLGYTALMIVGDTLALSYANASQFTNISFNMEIYELQDGETGILSMKFAQKPDHIETFPGSTKNSTAAIPDASMSHGEYHLNQGTNELSILYNGKGNDEEQPSGKRISLGVHRCFFEDCIVPTPPVPPSGRPETVRIWSDIDSWEGKEWLSNLTHKLDSTACSKQRIYFCLNVSSENPFIF